VEDNRSGLYPKKTIAELFGVTERRVEQLSQKKIVPKAGKGLFDLGPTVQAYIRYLHGLANGAISADTTELNQRLLQANVEEHEAKARMAELDLSVMQGRLHEAGDVKKIMADMIVSCRSRMLALPSKAAVTVSAMTDSAEIASFLRGLVYEALEELSGYDSDKFNELNEKYVPPFREEESFEGKNKTKDA
jgi:phage terminase Nu1 subunit (DNA packaging protein)